MGREDTINGMRNCLAGIVDMSNYVVGFEREGRKVFFLSDDRKQRVTFRERGYSAIFETGGQRVRIKVEYLGK